MTTYWYDARPVVDPISGGSVLVANADFTVHAYTDTAFATPLTVQTRLGGVLGSTSELHSTPNGILDEFSVEDEWRVWLKSGEHVVLHTSIQGLADSAEAARMAAEASQVAAELAAQIADTASAATTAQIDAHLGGPSAGLITTVNAKADDTAVVHNIGSETVNGAKTFTTSPTVPDGSFLPTKLSPAGAASGQGIVFNGSTVGWGTVASSGVTYGTTAGTAAQGNDPRIMGAAQKSANLSDLASAPTARTNLGLGNVSDTSDANKPISTLTAAALAGKQATIAVYSAHPDTSTLTPGTIYFLVTG